MEKLLKKQPPLILTQWSRLLMIFFLLIRKHFHISHVFTFLFHEAKYAHLFHEIRTVLVHYWHRFDKVLETFLTDLCPYWHNVITQFLQISWLHVHDENLPFLHIPKAFYWTGIWWQLSSVVQSWRAHARFPVLRWQQCYSSGIRNGYLLPSY